MISLADAVKEVAAEVDYYAAGVFDISEHRANIIVAVIQHPDYYAYRSGPAYTGTDRSDHPLWWMTDTVCGQHRDWFVNLSDEESDRYDREVRWPAMDAAKNA